MLNPRLQLCLFVKSPCRRATELAMGLARPVGYCEIWKEAPEKLVAQYSFSMKKHAASGTVDDGELPVSMLLLVQ